MLGAIDGIIFVLAADGNLWLIRTKFKIQIANYNHSSDFPCALSSALCAMLPHAPCSLLPAPYPSLRCGN
jgi:hypothetical protein